MKVLAALLCLFVAVQSNRVAVPSSRAALANLGENPWLVHLRIAVSTSGFLESCVGSLVNSRFVLTTASCLVNSRFIWVRYGAIDVIRPELVTESSVVTTHLDYNPQTGDNNIGIISINRDVETSANIAPIAPVAFTATNLVSLCGFGEDSTGGPGENLSCFDATLTVVGGPFATATSATDKAGRFDIGAPVVANGQQVGILISAPPATGNEAGRVLLLTDFLLWINNITGGSSLREEVVSNEQVIFIN